MQTIKTVTLSKFAKFSNIRLGAYYELPTLVFEYEPPVEEPEEDEEDKKAPWWDLGGNDEEEDEKK